MLALLTLPLLAAADTICVEAQYSADVTTDQEAIAKTVGGVKAGDTVLFGVDCDAAAGTATPTTYTLDSDISAKHGVIYDGAGSTLQLADRPEGDDWVDWRGVRLLFFGKDNTVTAEPTVLTRMTIDMNRDGQGAPVGDSAQYGVFFGGISPEEAAAAGGNQQVEVSDVSCVDSSYQCLSFYNYMDGVLTGVETSNNHHGVSLNHSVSGSLQLIDHAAYGDHTAVKIEGAATGRLTASVQDSILKSTDYAISWGVDCSGASFCALWVDGSDTTNLSIWGKDHIAKITDSNISDVHGVGAYPALYLYPREGSQVSIFDSAVSGYLYLPGVDRDFVGLSILGTTFSGRGRDGYAIFTTSEADDARGVWLGDGTTFEAGAEMDRLLWLVGGTVTLDEATQWSMSTDDVIVLNGSSAVRNVLIDADGATQYDSAVDGDDGRCAGDGVGGVSCWAD